MKMLIAIAAGMLAVGTGYHLEGSMPQGISDAAVQAPARMSDEVSRYGLFIAGNGIVCHVTKGRKLSERIAEIKLSEGCGEAYAGLARAALWHEGRHGDVTFTAKDGRTLVRFASGDGVAYESYRPTVPFISLVAEK